MATYSYRRNRLIKGISMNSYDEISTRIAEIIISPDSAIGFIHGILSVPVDLGYLAYGYLNTESRYSNQTEKR